MRAMIAVIFSMCAVCACGGGGASGGALGVVPHTSPTGAPASPTPGSTPVPSPASSGELLVGAVSGSQPISQDLLGVNVVTWFDDTQPFVEQELAATGLHLLRWPGGSESDTYHWATNSVCAAGGGYVAGPSTFDNFMADDARPIGADVAVTLNYGSNAACNGGGDPTEAQAWVAHAVANGENVKYYTVGNEVYGSWEFDLHAVAHDPTTYANAVATGYYPDVKAANANALVGVVVAGSYDPTWDQIVLQNARYDFVELHYYPQAPGSESDAYLLGQGVPDFTNALTSLRTEMTTYGVPASVPIYVGEINSVYADPGKQTVSIVQGLWAGMIVAEMMKQPGVTLSTWWAAFGGCSLGDNDPSSLYGWQNYGNYNLFSDGPASGCGTQASGTPFPDGRAYYLLSQFAPAGSTMRTSSLAAGVQNVRAYADQTPGGGYALLLFNLSETASQAISVQLTGSTKTSFIATQQSYGKAQYDQSENNLWPGPVSQSLGTVGTSFNVTLAPWSINVVTLQ